MRVVPGHSGPNGATLPCIVLYMYHRTNKSMPILTDVLNSNASLNASLVYRILKYHVKPET